MQPRDAATKRSKISVIFFSFSFSFGGEFSPFSEIVFGKQRILLQIHCFSFKILEKTILGPQKNQPKIAIIAYNMKGCLRFSTFIF